MRLWKRISLRYWIARLHLSGKILWVSLVSGTLGILAVLALGIFWHLRIMSRAESMQPEWGSLAAFAALSMLVGLGIVAVISQRAVRWVVHPLLHLKEEASRIADKKDFSTRLHPDGESDTDQLAETINILLDQIQSDQNELQQNREDHARILQEKMEEMRVALKNAEAASDAKSSYMATMSHELRTPLNAIIGVSSSLMHKVDDPEMAEQLEIIQKSGDNLLNLIRDVLDFSKIEAGKLELDYEDCELLPIIDGAIQMVASQKTLREGVRVYSTMDPEIPGIFRTDRVRLRQILVNLLSNAIKFTEEGFIWLEASIFSDNTSGRRLKLAVHDTGIGIEPEKLGLLFTSFAQIHNSSSRRCEGTGLGLVISKRLAEAMGGTISVASNPGKGTTFEIHLPLDAPSTGCSVQPTAPWPESLTPQFFVEGLPGPLVECLAQWFQNWGANCRLGNPSNKPCLRVDATSSHQSPRELQIPLKWPWSWGSLISRIGRALDPSLKGTSTKPPFPELDFSTRKLQLLLVEDNPVNQRVFQMVVRQLRLEVTIASGGNEALRQIQDQAWDFVFIDYQMPDMDGTVVATEIRKMGDKIRQPILVGFSANVQESAIQKMLAAGMDDFLPKPVKVGDISRILQMHLKDPQEI